MRTLLFVVAVSCTACVVGSERPASRLELARAPADPPAANAAALTAERSCHPVPESERAPKPGPDAQWIPGGCRGTSLGFEWAPGRWETKTAPRSWK